MTANDTHFNLCGILCRLATAVITIAGISRRKIGLVVTQRPADTPVAIA